MARGWNRIETWVGLIVLGIGGILLLLGGVWIYMSATATPLHPNAQAVASVGDAPPPQWTSAVERSRLIARTDLSERNLPGLSVAVGAEGKLVWAEGFGWADVDKQVQVTPATTFRIGTASTLLTAAAAGLLIESGTLSLDEAIQNYVPEYPRKQWPITLRHVMSHTGGVRTDSGDEGELFGSHCDRPVDAMPAVGKGELAFEPGSEFRYSAYGYILVSAAIEKAADQPFLSFIRKRIFDPLKMEGTIPDLSTTPLPDQATPYFPRFAGDPRYGNDIMRPIDLSCYAGASVFLSTASDLVRFVLAVNSGTVLQPDTVKMLQASQRLSSGKDIGYGLGWDRDTLTLRGTPATAIGHDGNLLGGMAVSVISFPDRGLAIAVLSNTSYAETASTAAKIADAFAQQD